MTDDRQKKLTEAFLKAFGESPQPLAHIEPAAPTVEGIVKILRNYRADVARHQDEEILLFLKSIPEEQWGWISAVHCFDRQGVWVVAPPRFTLQLVKPRTLSERWRSRKQRKAIAAYVAELRKDHR